MKHKPNKRIERRRKSHTSLKSHDARDVIQESPRQFFVLVPPTNASSVRSSCSSEINQIGSVFSLRNFWRAEKTAGTSDNRGTSVDAHMGKKTELSNGKAAENAAAAGRRGSDHERRVERLTVAAHSARRRSMRDV